MLRTLVLTINKNSVGYVMQRAQLPNFPPFPTPPRPPTHKKKNPKKEH